MIGEGTKMMTTKSLAIVMFLLVAERVIGYRIYSTIHLPQRCARVRTALYRPGNGLGSEQETWWFIGAATRVSLKANSPMT